MTMKSDRPTQAATNEVLDSTQRVSSKITTCNIAKEKKSEAIGKKF
jgi:hypothetical protein